MKVFRSLDYQNALISLIYIWHIVMSRPKELSSLTCALDLGQDYRLTTKPIMSNFSDGNGRRYTRAPLTCFGIVFVVVVAQNLQVVSSNRIFCMTCVLVGHQNLGGLHSFVVWRFLLRIIMIIDGSHPQSNSIHQF